MTATPDLDRAAVVAAELESASAAFHALGARGQARVFTYRRLGRIFAWVTARLARQAANIRGDEWRRGMHFPSRWDPLFKEFMTVEDVFLYPVAHFRFHVQQIAR